MRYIIAIVAAGVISSSPAGAQPDYCRQFAASLAPGELYQVRCPTPATCAVRVVDQFHFSVKRGSHDQFLYRTEETPVQNSLVVIQLQYLGVEPYKTASRVSLARQRIDFACYRQNHQVIQKAIPAEDPDDIDHAPSVSYSSYDRFYRSGGASWSDRQILENYQVRYFNGQACVHTTDDGRRQQFLFERREEQEGYLWTLASRLNIPELTTPAQAAPALRRYAKLHVLLGNYKKKPSTSGCVSFALPAQGAGIDVVLSDMEDNVLRNRVAPTKTWSLDVY